MPLTIAHTAILLPLRKTKFKFSFTALIVGSMVPDFEFFLQLREVENIGHHLLGVLLFDIPVATIFCYLFHELVKKNLLNNLPLFVKTKYGNTVHFNWSKYVLENKLTFIVSLLIGILSHIFLDAFTHHDGFFVLQNKFLNSKYSFFTHTISVFFLLQILLSIVGLILVAKYVFESPTTHTSNLRTNINYKYWLTFVGFFMAIFLMRTIVYKQYNTFWSIVMALHGSAIYAMLGTSLIFIQQKK